MSIKISPMAGTSKLVESQDYAPLSTLTKQQVIDECAEAGVILFRGFNTNIDDFSAFVRNNSSKVTLDPARTFYAENAQKVDAGLDAVGLHCENGNAPKLPHFIWFYCEKAAKSGSQTTYCDGREVWLALSESARNAFSEKKIKYSRNVPEHLWRAYLAYELPNISRPEDVTHEHLKLFSNAVEGQSFVLNEDHSVHYSFVVGAAHKTLFSDELSFANSILGPSYNYEKPVICFEDDTPISDALLAEIADVTEAKTQEIQWQKGDVVMIDNTRFMHGRRAIQDPEREIYAALSYL